MELAERVGVSFQQIQKYEKGTTRMSIFRLQQIAEALGMPLNTFFIASDTAPEIQSAIPAYIGDSEDSEQPFDKEAITFLKLFRRIQNNKVRDSILKQMRGIIEIEKG